MSTWVVNFTFEVKFDLKCQIHDSGWHICIKTLWVLVAPYGFSFYLNGIVWKVLYLILHMDWCSFKPILLSQKGCQNSNVTRRKMRIQLTIWLCFDTGHKHSFQTCFKLNFSETLFVLHNYSFECQKPNENILARML